MTELGEKWQESSYYAAQQRLPGPLEDTHLLANLISLRHVLRHVIQADYGLVTRQQ
jgi:hypothetical protein